MFGVNSMFSGNLQTGNMSIKDVKIVATPDTLIDNSQSVTLHVAGSDLSLDNGLNFEWKCRKYNNSNYKTDF